MILGLIGLLIAGPLHDVIPADWRCNECGAGGEAITQRVAQELAVLHVKREHPDTYREIIGKEPFA